VKYKKERGQSRKLKTLIDNIHQFVPFENTDARYEHFHVPSGQFISSPKTSRKIKTAFCKAWIQKTEEFLERLRVSSHRCGGGSLGQADLGSHGKGRRRQDRAHLRDAGGYRVFGRGGRA
jgi:hypothetical protein